jgi:hypothetical protein
MEKIVFIQLGSNVFVYKIALAGRLINQLFVAGEKMPV